MIFSGQNSVADFEALKEEIAPTEPREINVVSEAEMKKQTKRETEHVLSSLVFFEFSWRTCYKHFIPRGSEVDQFKVVSSS